MAVFCGFDSRGFGCGGDICCLMVTVLVLTVVVVLLLIQVVYDVLWGPEPAWFGL